MYAEPKAYDFMTKNVLIQKLPFDKYKQVYGSDDIVLVVIDDKSVEKYRWPWKRELYCEMLEFFSRYAKPKMIIDDSVLTSLDVDNPLSDKKYFNSLKHIDNYVTGFLPSYSNWRDADTGAKYDAEFEKKFSVKVNETDSIPELFRSLIPFPKPYFDAVKHIGSVTTLYGPINGSLIIRDEICRNQSYFIKYHGAFYPAMVMKAFLLLNNPKEIVITKDKIIFPDLKYQIDQKRTLFQTVTPIKFYNTHPNSNYSHINYSAIDVIESNRMLKNGKQAILDPELFRNKIVLFGSNAPAGAGLDDNKHSPIITNHPGVDIQASAIDNLIHGDFVRVLPQFVNFIITILGMLLVYFTIKMLSLSKAVPTVVLILFGYIFLSASCFYFDIVINVITPIVMFVLTTIFAYTHKYVLENKNKEKVKNAMGKYMSQDVMQRVVENIDNLGLGGKRAVVTVLFADIRGFTSISEKMSAQQVSEILNEYFSEMEPIITSYNGIINKFIGDAIMAIFGEPIQDENHAQNAVKCAYTMLKRVEKLHKKWYREGKPEIEIGIGINSGEVFVGNIGSVNRMEYTVIGDTVNLASRLESYNKMYKTKMLISTSTYKAVKNIVDVIKIPEVQIRGKANKIDIYEVLKVKTD